MSSSAVVCPSLRPSGFLISGNLTGFAGSAEALALPGRFGHCLGRGSARASLHVCYLGLSSAPVLHETVGEGPMVSSRRASRSETTLTIQRALSAVTAPIPTCCLSPSGSRAAPCRAHTRPHDQVPVVVHHDGRVPVLFLWLVFSIPMDPSPSSLPRQLWAFRLSATLLHVPPWCAGRRARARRARSCTCAARAARRRPRRRKRDCCCSSGPRAAQPTRRRFPGA